MKIFRRPAVALWGAAFLSTLSGTAIGAHLPFNTTLTGNLSQPGQQASYTFTGTPGQRLFYDSLQADFSNISVHLYSPSATLVPPNGNSDSDVGPFTLAESGTYTLIIDGTGATLGDYSFRLDDLSNPPALPLNTPITKILTPGYSVEWYQYNAVGNEHLYFDGQGGATGGNWSLFGPANDPLGSANLNGDFEVTLTQSGPHLIAIAGNSANPVPYSVVVSTAKYTTNKIQLDTVVSGTIANPGDQVIHTFTASAGQRLFYDSLEGNFDQIYAKLLNPNGTMVFINNANSDSDVGPFTLVDSGTYSLVIDGSGATTGSFSFKLVNLSTRPAAPLDTPFAKSLNPGYSTEWYTLNGTAGQTLYFDGLGSNAGGNWYLFGPSNEPLGSAGIGADFEVTLPRDGTYLVAMAGSSPNPVPFFVQIVTVDTPVTPLPLGTTITGTIAEPGEKDSFTFTGTAGQRLYYDALDRDFEGINARLISPTGVVLWEINHSSDRDPFTLTQAGTYTLVLDGNGGAVGDYSFRLLDLATAVPMNLTSTVTGALIPRSKTDVCQFNGTKGQRISFLSISATSNEATWRLVTPANVTIASGNIVNSLPSVVLPETGVMLLFVEGTAETASPLNYQIRLTDISGPPTVISGLNTVLTGSVVNATPVTNTFSAAAGVVIYFDSQDRTSSGVGIDIRDPANAVLQSFTAANDAGPYLLPAAGKYSVVVRGTGSYRFRILDLATVPTLTLGAEAQANLDPGYRTDVYQFSGVPGQRLFYDALETDNDAINTRLLAPDVTLRLNINSDTEFGPITLAVPGTYYLFVESNISTVGDYHFRLHDIDTAPVLPIETPVNGTLTPGISTTLYRFHGDAGRRLFFDATGSNNGGQWALYGPNNEVYLAPNITGDIEQVLPVTGNYVLALIGASANPVPFSFQVYEPNAVVGGPVLTSITLNGGNATVAWTAVAGKTYTLQFKATLSDLTWTNVPGAVVAAGATATKTDTVGVNARRFYRVLQAP